MAKWRDIIESEDYKSLPLSERIKTKNEFFRNTISQSEKFTKLPKEEQAKLKTEFFTTKSQENLEPFLPEKPTLMDIGKYAVEEFQQRSPFALLDKPVEEVSKFIEPDTAKEGLLGAIKFIPRQMLAEVVRGYKPSSVAPFFLGVKTLGLGGKVLKPITKPVAKKLFDILPKGIQSSFTKTGEFLAKNLTVGKGQPVAYQKLAKTTALERGIGEREAETVAKALTQKPTGEALSIPEQRYIGRIFRKEIIESPALKVHPRYQELKSISDEGRAIMDKWSQELVKSGIPEEQVSQVIEENVGSYMARMYSSKLAKTKSGFGMKQLRLRLDGLKHRKNLSDDVRNLLGEIKEPAFPTAVRVKQISTSVANNKLFNTVSSNPEWVADTNLTGNLVKMADSPALGALKGKWVIPEIAKDINALVVSKKTANDFVAAYNWGLDKWKYGKVVLNPAAQTRNILSNTMLLDLSGTNHIRQAQLFPSAIKEYLKRGDLYKQALDDGAIGGEWVGSEISKLREIYMRGSGGNTNRLLNALKYPFKKAENFYQGNEQLSKMIKYMDVLSKGGTREKAAEEAQKWIFNYNDIPEFIKVGKQVSPFITFTYKSVPRIAEAMVNRPLTVYKYKAIFDAFNETSRKLQGMSPVDYAKENNSLPPWIQKSIGGVPTNILLPWKDKYNRTQWFNLEYILPVGMAPEISKEGLGAIVRNPLYQIVSDLEKNTDFRGKEIVPVGSTSQEAIKAQLGYIYRQIAPPLAPAIGDIKGGYSWEKLMDSVKERPDYYDRIKDLPTTALDVLFGLKINLVDVDEAQQFKMWDKKKKLEALQGQVRRLNHPAISEKEREFQSEDLFKKMQKVIGE